MSTIRVTIDPLGFSRVWVGDRELEHVSQLAVSAVPGDLSRLWIELVAPDGLEIETDPALIFYGYEFEEDI